MKENEKLTVAMAYEQVNYHGDAVHPLPGQHELRVVVAETICRLPEEVQDWLLYETSHVFIGGYGHQGQFFELWVHPKEFRENFAVLRVIFLSEQLMNMPKEEALWTVAHEIAHSWLKHEDGSYEVELAADRLVSGWGFTEPPTRKAERERYKI